MCVSMRQFRSNFRVNLRIDLADSELWSVTLALSADTTKACNGDGYVNIECDDE